MMFKPSASPKLFADPVRSFEIRFSFTQRDERDLDSLNRLLSGLPVSHVELHVVQGYIARVRHYEPDGSGGSVATSTEYHAGVDEGVLVCREDRRQPRHICRIDEQALQGSPPDDKTFIADWEKQHPDRKVVSLNWRPSDCDYCGCFIIHREKSSSSLC